MENLLNLIEKKDEIVIENAVLTKKLVEWKDKNTGKVTEYYAWVLKVATKDHEVFVTVKDPTGKLKILDEVGYLTYKK